MKFKFVCYYHDATVMDWKSDPKIAIINAKSEKGAAEKFRKKFPNCTLTLVDKAFSHA